METLVKETSEFPLVSIIVPSYNHRDFLDKRLASIFNQTFQDFEVILLDDCSTDESNEILKKYAKNQKVSHLVINEKNSGSTFKQWKRGIEIANGDLIWIAESDDWADINFLEKLVSCFINERVALAFCDSFIVENKIITEKKTSNWYKLYQSDSFTNNQVIDGKLFCWKHFTELNYIPNASSVIFKRKFFNPKIFDTKLKMVGDWKFWFQILINGGSVYYYPYPLNYFRRHESNVSRANFQLKLETIFLLKYFLKELKKRKLPLNYVLINLYKWCFKDYIWERKFYYNLVNLKLLLYPFEFSTCSFLLKLLIKNKFKPTLISDFISKKSLELKTEIV